MPNLQLPGNPRYQPKLLQDVLGYDNLNRTVVEVEIAVMRTLADMDIIPAADIALLTPEVEAKLLAITTTEVDRVEKTDTPEFGKATKHDVRAVVRIMQSILPGPLRRWVHVPLTSYDALDTARTLWFLRAHENVIKVHLRGLIKELADKVKQYAHVVQIGRTHGQHALPITVGFWLATILSRIVYNAEQMNYFANGLVGKISGAVGAHNAQVGLGLFHNSGGELFEDLVMKKLGLSRASISTQILPPEPLAYYLFSSVAMSASLGQLGRDCRHLMRSEIGEVSEPFSKGQVGSSTMAQKRNPINFEGTEGGFFKNIAEFSKVFMTLISEHQRDLVGSSLMRDFPTIIVNLTTQLDTLLRKDSEAGNRSFIERIVINEAALEHNLKMSGGTILAEPLYIVLQMAGYSGDAHELVNHYIVPAAIEGGWDLPGVIESHLDFQPELKKAWVNVPDDVKRLLRNPHLYIGDAKEQALKVAGRALEFAAV